MAQQLLLISPAEVDWRLDERTKELGRRGVADARAALQRLSAPLPAKSRPAR